MRVEPHRNIEDSAEVAHQRLLVLVVLQDGLTAELVLEDLGRVRRDDRRENHRQRQNQIEIHLELSQEEHAGWHDDSDHIVALPCRVVEVLVNSGLTLEHKLDLG